MRSIRLRRVAVLFAAALGLFATQVPAAHAADALVVVVKGSATLDGPLGYPCVQDGGGGPNLAKCTTPTTNDKKIPVGVTGGQTRAVNTFASAQCVAAGTYLGKTADPTSPCAVVNVEAGVVTGACGMSQGLILLSITILWIDGTETLTLAWVHWTSAATTLVVTGTTYDGKLIVGAVNAVPLPVAGVPVGNSCLGKSATTFEISGEVTIS